MLGIEGEELPANPTWRALTVEYYKYLSKGSSTDPSKFSIEPNQVRLMPGGLEKMVQDGFELLGWGKIIDREPVVRKEPWMKPISGEKLVYHIDA